MKLAGSASRDAPGDASPLLPLEGEEEFSEQAGDICDLLNTTLWQDVWASIYDSRYISALVLMLALCVSYAITIAPYSVSRPSLTEEQRSLHSLQFIRPVLSDEKMSEIYSSTLFGETSFALPEPFYDIVKVRFQSSSSKHGHFRLPELFYEGVVYGLTWQNSHQLEYYRPDATLEKLQASLKLMEPRPTKVFLRTSRNNITGWSEDGLSVHFSRKHLEEQGMLSSDSAQPWKRTLEPMLNIARDFKLAYVYIWFPHQFGSRDASDPHKHEIVIQQVTPTRTGLDGIKSSATVWLAAVNLTEPTIPPKIIRKPWSSDDHWSQYPVT